MRLCGSCWSTRDPAWRTGTCAHAEEDHGLWKCPQHLLWFLRWLPSPCLHQVCFRAVGLTLTLRAVEHPFGLHLPSEGFISWPVRAKLC